MDPLRADTPTNMGQKGPLLDNLAARQKATEFAADFNSIAVKKFGGFWKLLFFLGAAATLGAGVSGVLGAVMTMLSPFSFCNQIYLCIFGLIMLVIDFPLEWPIVVEVKYSIFRYLLFMTRFTGRGFWYLYLATMIWASLFNLGLNPLLGFILAIYVGAVGICSILFGLSKSLKLEGARKKICAQGGQAVFNMVGQGGMSLGAFNEMCKRYAETSFTAEELGYIAGALSFTVRADDMISQEEFRAWTQGRMTIL